MKTKKQMIQEVGEFAYLFGEIVRPVSGLSRRYYRGAKAANRISLLKSSNLFIIEEGNDAPRGGQFGEFVKFIPKIKKRKLIAAYNAQLQIDIANTRRIAAERLEAERIDKEAQTARAIDWLRNKGGIQKMIEHAMKSDGNAHQRGHNAGFRYAGEANAGASILTCEFEAINGRVYARL